MCFVFRRHGNTFWITRCCTPGPKTKKNRNNNRNDFKTRKLLSSAGKISFNSFIVTVRCKKRRAFQIQIQRVSKCSFFLAFSKIIFSNPAGGNGRLYKYSLGPEGTIWKFHRVILLQYYSIRLLVVMIRERDFFFFLFCKSRFFFSQQSTGPIIRPQSKIVLKKKKSY